MERNSVKTQDNKKDAGYRNSVLAHQVIGNCLNLGVEDYCICPGARNSALIDCLTQAEGLRTYYFYDERSAGFFALGRSRATTRPVAIITTSGTAVGELLPPLMEAYYSGVPLLVVSADRPRSFRGSGAPQAAEQKGIFGIYAPFSIDVAYNESFSFDRWSLQRGGQLNVCFEEAYSHNFEILPDLPPLAAPNYQKGKISNIDLQRFNDFCNQSSYPIAVVSTLLEKDQEAVTQFLKKLKIPTYCEAISGLRESIELDNIRILNVDNLWTRAKNANYPIDGVLRIGGVPTARMWRDLEKMQESVNVCSISQNPFSGLSWGDVIHTDISEYLGILDFQTTDQPPVSLIREDKERNIQLQNLILSEKTSEVGMFSKLSDVVAEGAFVYLGNSLPIREWDLAATHKQKRLNVQANRGLNGIDGQLSTFFGLSDVSRPCWAILGDLTTLYDLSAPWILKQLGTQNITIVVINNSGGKIFSRLFANEKLQNNHDFNLKGMAELWQMDYTLCEGEIDIPPESAKPRLVECVPDNESTERFWQAYKSL